MTQQPTRAELQEVLIAPPLRIRYLAGSAPRLVVSLAGVGTERHAEPPNEFFRLASQGGENHVLFVSDESRSWLNHPGIAEQIAATIENTARSVGAEEIVALGNSMGASMALILSTLTRIDRVAAFTPQFSVDPSVMPEETRWSFFRNRIAWFRYPAVDTLPPEKTLCFIFHGTTDDELRHAVRFGDAQNIDHYLLPGFGHTLARDLHASGELARLVQFAISGRRFKLRQAMRALGAQTRAQLMQAAQENE